MGVIAADRTRMRIQVAPETTMRRGRAVLLCAALLAPILVAIGSTAPAASAATTNVFPVVQATATDSPPSAWSTTIRSAGIGLRKMAGPLAATTTASGRPAVFGLSSQSKILALIGDGIGGRAWNTYPISTITGTGAVNPGVAPLLDPNGSLNAFAVTTAGHLIHLWLDAGTWSGADLTVATSSPNVTGAPTAVLSEGHIVVVTRTVGGRVLETIDDHLHGGRFSTYNLTALANGPKLSTDLTALDNPDGHGLLHLYGLDRSGHLVEYVDDDAAGRYWNAYDLTAAAGASTSLKGDPTAVVWGGRTRIIALSSDAHAVMYSANSASGTRSWTTKDLSARTAGTPTLRSAPAAAVAGSALLVAGTTPTKHLVSIVIPGPQAEPQPQDISQVVPGIPTFTGRASVLVHNGRSSVFASALSLPVAGSVGVYAYPSPGRALSDGWPIIGVTGALGTCSSPWTGLGFTHHNSNDEQTGFAIQNSGRQVPWMSYWTVSGPTNRACRARKDQSPAAFYRVAHAGAVWVAQQIDSYVNDGLGLKPSAVILDDEGYPDLHSGFANPSPAMAPQFAAYVQGWVDGLASVDPSLSPGVYVSQSEYLAFHVAELPIATYIAVAWGGSTPPHRLPGVDGANIKGFIAFFVNSNPTQECALAHGAAALLSSWGAPWNTLQFDAGVACRP